MESKNEWLRGATPAIANRARLLRLELNDHDASRSSAFTSAMQLICQGPPSPASDPKTQHSLRG